MSFLHTQHFNPAPLSLAVALAFTISGVAQAQTTKGAKTPIPSASDQAPTTLPAVKVTGSRDDDGITEGTGSYTTRSSSTATKLNLSPRETPQTLTVITRQKIDDFALTDIDKALESTSTVSVIHRGGNGAYYFSRGFRLQSQYDGLPNPTGLSENNYNPAPDTAFLDKVEILQGASGLMSGAGDPGGTINLVRKRPTENFQAHIEAELGSWKKKRLVGDVSSPLAASGRVRGRVVALVDRRDSFVDYAYNNKLGFYGVVDADVTSTTIVGASVMYQKNDYIANSEVPMGPNGADLGFPRSAFFSVADGGTTKEAISYTLNLEQKLPKEWSLKAAYTHTDTTVDSVTGGFLNGTLNVANGSGLSLASVAILQRELHSNVFDLYASGPLQFFGRKHELVVGMSSAETNGKDRDSVSRTTTPIPNIYNYDVKSISRPPRKYTDWSASNDITQQGVYGAFRLNLTDSLKAILGTRVSWYEDHQNGAKESAVVTPYAGLIFDINDNTSIYASYSDIFKPQDNLKFGGGTIDPVVGKNYEMGVKSEFLQGRLNASAAVFRLEQTNLSQVDINVPLTACSGGHCYTAAGLVVSQGIDLGLNGELLPGWQVGAGYSWVTSKYDKNDIGSRIKKGDPYNSYLPKQILRVYTTYQIPGTAWTVGGNIRAQNRVYTQRPTFRIEQGGYSIVGLMAKYQIKKHAEISLMVDNLFDRRYYDPISGRSVNYESLYGTPRTFTANLKYVF